LSRSLQLAVITALIVLVRHPNAIYLAAVPLWNPRRVLARWRTFVLIAAIAAVCVTPQLVIYYRATGRVFVSVYALLGTFHFASPRIASVLIGVQKGLFFWSPVLVFAVAGWFVADGWARGLMLPTAVIFAVVMYLIASWSDWQFGASYGHRGFTDGLAFAAVFLAACFDRVRRRRRWLVPAAVLVSALVCLSTFQMYQYWRGILPNADTTWTQYRERFLRLR
jgi:hypothetical protein